MPPTFRAAVLAFGQGNLAAASNQPASMFPNMLARAATVGTRRMLGHIAGVLRQLLEAKLLGHHVANANHGVLNVVDRLPAAARALGFFLCQHLRHQRFYTLFHPVVFYHPWLLYLN